MAGDGGERSVVGGSAYLFGSRLTLGLLSYVGTAAVARALTKPAWGGFTFVISIAGLIGAVFEFYGSRLVLEEIFDERLDTGRTVGSYLMLRLTFGVASYIAVMAFVVLANYPASVQRAMLVGGLVMMTSPAWSSLFLYFQAKLWLRSVGVVMVLSRVLFLALTLIMIGAGVRSLELLFIPITVADVVVLGALFVIVSRHIRVRFVIEPARWRRWLRETIPITIGAAIGTVYFRLDTIMLSRLDTFTAVGLYGIGYKFSDLIAALPGAVLAPALTLMVKAWPLDLAAFRRVVRGTLTLLVVAAFGLATSFFVFARPAIELLYGERYGVAAGAARLVVIGQALRFFTAMCTTLLMAVRRNVFYAMASIAGLVVNVGLNLWLIPRHSYNGAALATVITELGVLIILVGAVHRIEGIGTMPWAVVARTVVASAALVLVALAMLRFVPWPVAAASGAAAFLAVLHALGVAGPGGLRAVPHLLQVEPTDTVVSAAPPPPTME